MRFVRRDADAGSECHVAVVRVLRHADRGPGRVRAISEAAQRDLADVVYDAFPQDENGLSVTVIEPSGEPEITPSGLRSKTGDDLKKVQLVINACAETSYSADSAENRVEIAAAIRSLARQLDEIGIAMEGQVADAA